jgi:hypothetical protein
MTEPPHPSGLIEILSIDLDDVGRWLTRFADNEAGRKLVDKIAYFGVRIPIELVGRPKKPDEAYLTCELPRELKVELYPDPCPEWIDIEAAWLELRPSLRPLKTLKIKGMAPYGSRFTMPDARTWIEPVPGWPMPILEGHGRVDPDPGPINHPIKCSIPARAEIQREHPPPLAAGDMDWQPHLYPRGPGEDFDAGDSEVTFQSRNAEPKPEWIRQPWPRPSLDQVIMDSFMQRGVIVQDGEGKLPDLPLDRLSVWALEILGAMSTYDRATGQPSWHRDTQEWKDAMAAAKAREAAAKADKP